MAPNCAAKTCWCHRAQGQARQGRLRDPLPPWPRHRRAFEDGQGAGLALPDGSVLAVPAWRRGEITIEESIWVDGQGRPQPIQQLVMQGLVSRGGGNFAWLLKKMG
jgi:hypothetical protein